MLAAGTSACGVSIKMNVPPPGLEPGTVSLQSGVKSKVKIYFHFSRTT